MVVNPVNQAKTRLHEHFRFFATQNSAALAGRNVLPEYILMRSLVAEVPEYKPEQVTKILQGMADEESRRYGSRGRRGSLQDFVVMSSVLKDHRQRVASRCAEEFNAPGKLRKWTLREMHKLLVRCCADTNPLENFELHYFVLLGDNATEGDQKHGYSWTGTTEGGSSPVARVECGITMVSWSQKAQPHPEDPRYWKFSFLAGSKEICVYHKVPSEAKMLEPLLMKLGDQSQRALCSMAFAVKHKEAVLLEGPGSSSKSTMAELLAFMLQGPQSFTVLPCSASTTLEDLLGAIEPHNQESYCSHARAWLQKAEAARPAQDRTEQAHHHAPQNQNVEANAEDQEDIPIDIEGLKERLRKLEKDGPQLVGEYSRHVRVELEKIDGQSLPFVDRGLMPSFRLGGQVLLKHLDVMDTAVLERLNQLFATREILWQDSRTLQAHVDLQLIATIRTPSASALSEAMRSRLTKVKFEQETFPDPLAKAYSCSPVQTPCQTARCLAWSATALRGLQFIDAGNLLDDMADAAVAEYVHKILLGSSGQHECETAAFLSRLLQKHQELTVAEASQRTGWTESSVKDAIQGNAPPLAETPDLRAILTRLAMLDVLNLAARASSIVAEPGESKTASLLVHAMPVFCIVGPPGTGKTVTCELAARLLKRKFVRISCSSCTSWDDLFGMVLPKNTQHGTEFTFQEGVLVTAMRNGALILLDEVNLLQEDLLRRLAETLGRSILVQTGGSFALQVRDLSISLTEPPLFVAAMNPPSVGGGRMELPPWFSELFCTLHVKARNEEVELVIEALYRQSFQDTDNQKLRQAAIDVTKDLRGAGWHLSVRTLQRLSRLHYWLLHKHEASEEEDVKPTLLTFSEKFLRLGDQMEEKPEAGHSSPDWMQDALTLASTAGPFILVTGPTCSGKTTAIRQFAKAQGKQLITINAHAGSSTTDFLGNFMLDASALELGDAVRIRSTVNTQLDGSTGQILSVDVDSNMCTVLTTSTVQCVPLRDIHPLRDQQKPQDLRFLKGPLRRAIEQAETWLLVENVNVAPPEAVERLNSLGERPPSWLNE